MMPELAANVSIHADPVLCLVKAVQKAPRHLVVVHDSKWPPLTGQIRFPFRPHIDKPKRIDITGKSDFPITHIGVGRG